MSSYRPPKDAIIYCRVSDPKQKTEGTGLASQERHCREFARYRNYNVIAVYQDDITGKVVDREGINAALAHLRKLRNTGLIVIIDDISRLGRDREAYFPLKDAIKKYGGILASPSIEFGDDANSIFFEEMMVAGSGYQRRKIVETTNTRMRARLQNGFWCFHVPPGFKYVFERYQGKVVRIHEDVGPVVKEAIEGFASGRFERQVDVQEFLQDQPNFPRGKSGKVQPSHVEMVLKNPFYAGFLHKPDWGINMQKGAHPALVSVETWQRVQDRIAGVNRAPNRRNLSDDFPLRGYVVCECGTPYTASWSKGRSKHHAYYLCHKKTCEHYGKSIKREHIEGSFEELLGEIQPQPKIVTLATMMFRDASDQHSRLERKKSASLEKKLKEIEREIEKLLDRVLEVTTSSVIAVFEKRIEKLEQDKALLIERIAESRKPAPNVDARLRTALGFLKNPRILWDSGRLKDRQTVLKLTFGNKLRYVRGKGFRTAELSLPFKVMQKISGAKKEMVPLAGLEPARLAATDFESAASTIPPQGHWSGISGLDVEDRARARQSAGSTGGAGLRRQTTLSFTSMLPRVALEYGQT